jgi:hypothetical protein
MIVPSMVVEQLARGQSVVVGRLYEEMSYVNGLVSDVVDLPKR